MTLRSQNELIEELQDKARAKLKHVGGFGLSMGPVDVYYAMGQHVLYAILWLRDEASTTEIGLIESGLRLNDCANLFEETQKLRSQDIKEGASALSFRKVIAIQAAPESVPETGLTFLAQNGIEVYYVKADPIPVAV